MLYIIDINSLIKILKYKIISERLNKQIEYLNKLEIREKELSN